jgi:phage/plasmid-like protein (TIGR03299 family)
MSHEISQVEIDGVQVVEAMYANSPAWHQLGTIFKPGEQQAPTSAQAIKLAHLDWKVELEDMKGVTTGSNYERFRGTYRSDTQAGLGVVGTQYTILQNQEAFNFLDSLLSEADMRYESAFALKGGREVCLLARMPSIDEIAPGDRHLRYVFFKNTHDGSGAIGCYPTGVRTVCANTVRLAEQLAGNLQYTIRHSGDMHQKLEVAKQYLSQFDEAFDLFREQGRELVNRKFSQTELEEYLEQLFPSPDAKKKRAVTIRHNKLERIAANHHNQMKSSKGTWWGLFNSVTQYLDHQGQLRGKDERAKHENRFQSVIMGDKAKTKDFAFALALQMAGVGNSA